MRKAERSALAENGKIRRSVGRKISAFTLVELIVVITILAILATVGFLSLSGYSDDARSATVKANVRTVYSAILSESTTTGNSPRYYVEHSTGAALSGAFVFVDGKQVALTGGDLGVGDSNYTAGNPRWDRLRMNGEKFKLAFTGPEWISEIAPDASAAYSTGELAVGAVDVFKTGANGKKRNLPVFQVAGVVSGSKTAVVTGNYTPGAGAGSPSLLRDVTSTIPSAPLTEPRTVATITGDDSSGRKWSDGTYAKSCLEYASSLGGRSYAGSIGNGTYWIDPDGAGGNAEFKAYCDMTTDGGGWTLAISYADNSFWNGTSVAGNDLFLGDAVTVEQKAQYDAAVLAIKTRLYHGTAPIGNLATFQTADTITSAYLSVPFSETMFTDNAGKYLTYGMTGSSLRGLMTGVSAQGKDAFPVVRTNVPTSVNVWNDLTVRLQVNDDDSGYYGIWHSQGMGPCWPARNNDAVLYDDGGICAYSKYLGGQNAGLSSYVLWYVR